MLHNHLHITMHVYDTWWIDITIYLNLQQYYLIMSHLHTPLGGAPSRRWVERWRVVANGWPAALDDWRVRCLAAVTMAQLSQHWLETISQGISIHRFQSNSIQSLQSKLWPLLLYIAMANRIWEKRFNQYYRNTSVSNLWWLDSSWLFYPVVTIRYHTSSRHFHSLFIICRSRIPKSHPWSSSSNAKVNVLHVAILERGGLTTDSEPMR